MAASGTSQVSGGGSSLSSQVAGAAGATTVSGVGGGPGVAASAGATAVLARTAASIDVSPPADRGIVLEQVGVGSTRVLAPDTYRNPFNIGLTCELQGAATYTLEHTFEDVFSPTFDASTAVWFPNVGFSSVTASGFGNYAFPVNGLRLRVSAGAGTVRAYIAQAGTR